MPLLDTHQNKDLTSTLIDDIDLQLLSYVAQTEREVHSPTSNGRSCRRKQQDVKSGRRPMARSLEYKGLKNRWRQGKSLPEV